MNSIVKSTTLFIAGAGFFAIGQLGFMRLKPPDPPAPGKGPRIVAAPKPISGPRAPARALGSIQPDGGVREVALPPGAIPRHLAEGVAVGRDIREGQPLAYLDGYEERKSEIHVIVAEIAAAERSLSVEDENEKVALEDIDREQERADRLGRLQLDSMALKIECLVEKAKLARGQFEAVKGLQTDRIVSGQEHNNLHSMWKVSETELEYSRLEKRRSEAELDSNINLEAIERRKRQVRVAARRARAQFSLETLKQKKALAVSALSRFVVVAPIDGTVLEITTHPGEAPTGNPLLKLGDTRRLYVLAEVYEDDRKKVEIGQTAEIRGQGLPIGKDQFLTGTVERIGPMIGHRRQYPLSPTSRDNARVYPAWIRLNRNERLEETLRKYILQPVDVKIVQPDDGEG